MYKEIEEQLKAEIERLNNQIKIINKISFWTLTICSIAFFVLLIHWTIKGNAFWICWNSGFLVWSIYNVKRIGDIIWTKKS